MKENESNQKISLNFINADITQNSLKNFNVENDLFNLQREENKNNKKEEEEEGKGEAKRKLMFGVKKISPFRLYYHISGKFEIFLMIMGVIFTIGAGCSGALISLLLGDTINDFTDTSEINNLTDEEYKAIIDQVEPSVNKIIKKIFNNWCCNVRVQFFYDVFMGLFFFKTNALDENKLFLFNIETRTRMVR